MSQSCVAWDAMSHFYSRLDRSWKSWRVDERRGIGSRASVGGGLRDGPAREQQPAMSGARVHMIDDTRPLGASPALVATSTWACMRSCRLGAPSEAGRHPGACVAGRMPGRRPLGATWCRRCGMPRADASPIPPATHASCVPTSANPGLVARSPWRHRGVVGAGAGPSGH